MDKWMEYEWRKKQIRAKDSADYERQIKELATELGI